MFCRGLKNSCKWLTILTDRDSFPNNNLLNVSSCLDSKGFIGDVRSPLHVCGDAFEQRDCGHDSQVRQGQTPRVCRRQRDQPS